MTLTTFTTVIGDRRIGMSEPKHGTGGIGSVEGIVDPIFLRQALWYSAKVKLTVCHFSRSEAARTLQSCRRCPLCIL